MLPSLLIMVREGFEAALIVALVLAYLRRIGRADMTRFTLLGVGAAIAASVMIGVTLQATVGSLEGAARLQAFAAISLLAAGVLTWMVFWMRTQSRAIKGHLEQRVGHALEAERAGYAVAAVAFLAVLREGIEAALFLVAAATSAAAGQVVVGGLIGIAIAVFLGFGVYAAGRKMPMRAFFKVSGLVVIVFAAGLAARTVLFLQSAEVIGTVNNAVYDLTAYGWLTQDTEVGKFLAAMFGWDPRPSLEQLVAWAGYILPVTFLFLRAPRRRQPAAAAQQTAVVTVPEAVVAAATIVLEEAKPVPATR
jgi:high-affinity iron transporter